MDRVVDRFLIASVVTKDPSVLSGDQDGSQVNPDIAIDDTVPSLLLSDFDLFSPLLSFSALSVAT